MVQLWNNVRSFRHFSKFIVPFYASYVGLIKLSSKTKLTTNIVLMDVNNGEGRNKVKKRIIIIKTFINESAY